MFSSLYTFIIFFLHTIPPIFTSSYYPGGSKINVSILSLALESELSISSWRIIVRLPNITDSVLPKPTYYIFTYQSKDGYKIILKRQNKFTGRYLMKWINAANKRMLRWKGRALMFIKLLADKSLAVFGRKYVTDQERNFHGVNDRHILWKEKVI